MVANDISAGQLTIMYDGVLIIEQSYEWLDKKRAKPLPVGALMRVASVTKPFTAAAVRTLIAPGKLALDTRMFSLRPGDGGILDLAPFGKPDARLGNITVEDCPRHRGGWDRKLAGDLTRREKGDAHRLAAQPHRDGALHHGPAAAVRSRQKAQIFQHRLSAAWSSGREGVGTGLL